MFRNPISALRLSRSSVITAMNSTIVHSQFGFQTNHASRAFKIANLYNKNPIRSFSFKAANRFAEIIKTQPNSAQSLTSLAAYQDTSIHQALSSNHLVTAVTSFTRLAIAAAKRKPPALPVAPAATQVRFAENTSVQLQSSPVTAPFLSTKRFVELAISASRQRPPALPATPSNPSVQRVSSVLSSEQLAKLVLAATRRAIPSVPASPTSPKSNTDELQKASKPQPRSILKAHAAPALQKIPGLSPAQIFQGILDLNLVSERNVYEEDGEVYTESDEAYRERVMDLCRALTQQERNELAEYVNVVRGTSIQTAKLNPPEKPYEILERLNIRNENRRRTNEHNDRLEEHSPSRLQFNASVSLFKVARGKGAIEPHSDNADFEPEMKQVSLRLNENDRHESAIETVTVSDQAGRSRTKRVPRTFYTRDESDSLSVTNQLLEATTRRRRM